MKRSLKIAFAIAATITILTMGHPLYAGKPQVGRATAAQAQRVACCVVTAIGSPAGVITAKENATGRTFEFQAPSTKVMPQIHIGMPVYANFSTMQVSLNGAADCCKIISISPLPAAVAPAPAAKPTPGAPAAAAPMTVKKTPPHKPDKPEDCTITALNTYTGVVTATEIATGQTITFQIAHFQPIDGAKLSQTFKVGGKVDFQPIDGAALTSGSNVRLTVQGFQPIDGIVASISAAAAPATATLAAGEIQNKPGPVQSCTITALNTYTGVVTATEIATGQTITFQIAHFQPIDGAKLSQTFKVGGKVDFQPIDGAALTSGSNVRLTVQGFQPIDGIVASIGTAAMSSAASAATTQPASKTLAPSAAPMAVGEVRNKLAPAAPNCTISAINSTTGVVTAKENATAKTFEFKLNEVTQLKSLNVGKGVYANFAAGQVSMDGITSGGTILSSTSSGATSSAATSPAATSSTTKSLATKSLAGTTAVGEIGKKLASPAPCCGVTAIDTGADVVTATENATSKIFQFKLNDATQLHSLKIGQGVYANFQAKQVSLNGSSPAGNIIVGEIAYTGFDPKKHGFDFTNFFTGQVLIDVPPFGTVDLGPTSYGLCGGMSYSALDNFIYGGTIPNDVNAPASGTPLRSYIYDRQHDTFMADNAWLIPHFIEWVAYPDTTTLGVTGLDVRSFKEFLDNIQPELAAGHPVPLGLVKANISTASVTSTSDNVLVQNHQVLAIGYLLHKDPVNGTHWDIQIYDPNFPGSIQLMHTHSNIPGYEADATSGQTTGSFRGFFATPYSLKQPYWVSGGQQASAVAIAERTPLEGALSASSAQQRASTSSAGSSARQPAGSAKTLAALEPASVVQNIRQLGALPKLSYGAPQPAPSGPRGMPARWEASGTYMHLRGFDGIEQAQGIPEGVKTLLKIHVMALEPGEPDHYLVNPQLALEWSKTHPVPPEVKPPSTSDGHSGCSAWSIHCAGEVVKHAQDETSRQAQMLRQQAQADWKHWGTELTKDWHEAEGCLADNTLALDDIPIEFAASPSVGIHLERSGKTTNGSAFGGTTGGSASGKAEGTVNLALPMNSPDFRANLEVFYIPCLPFMVRPKSIGGHGTVTVGSRLTAAVKATGQFDENISTGSAQLPIVLIPIVLFGVPIAEMQVSAYVEGNIEVSGQGAFTANFELDNPHEMKLEFACSGHGCTGRSMPVAVPTTATETAQLNGRIRVEPTIFTAIQLDFDFGALTARAGPQPYLLGEIYGCVGAAASQNLSSGSSTAQEWHGLVGDVDWGVDLRGQVLMGGDKVFDKTLHGVIKKNTHIWFKDLWPGGSNALYPLVDGAAQASMSTPALYQIKMPACYPYPDKVRYQLTWTGGATASSGASGGSAATRSAERSGAALKLVGNGSASTSTNASGPCNLQSDLGSCEFDPAKDFALDLVWPTAGNYNLTVTAVSDTHGREYKSAQPTSVNVTVQ